MRRRHSRGISAAEGKARLWLRLLPLIPIASLLSCGDSPSGADNRGGDKVKLIIVDDQGRTPPSYAIHVTPEGGNTVSACCAGGASDQSAVAPVPDGCLVAIAADSFSVVVKAAGFRTARHAFSRRASGKNPLRVGLERLDSAFVSQDYATRFPAQGGEGLFRALAVQGSGETGTTFTVKFYIDRLGSAPVVYFQNTKRHPLHYDFVRDVLGRPLTLGEFEERTYRGRGRSAMAGSLVWRAGYSIPGDAATERIDAPFTVEFFPADDLTPDQALKASLLVEERVLFPGICGPGNRIHYLPPTAAHEAALAAREGEFNAGGMRWVTRESLLRGVTRQFLNAGEAYGTLRLLSPENLIASPVSYRDIVVLSRLPNEMPLVGGTITEEFQTPLSHVNVAARSRKTPNLAFPGASAQPAISALRDSLVRFKVTADAFTLEKATREEAEAFWAKIHPEAPVIPEPDLGNAQIEPFSRLSFGDRTHIGVKAANLAELSKLLDGHAPGGFAVPFSRYADFLGYARMTGAACVSAESDCSKEGRDQGICAEVAAFRNRFCGSGTSLRAFIDTLLADARFQADSRLREASLDGLRYLMRHIPVDSAFARSLDAFTDSLFHGKRVRLRSSTNAEDLEDFSGAGLYSSTGADAGGPESPSAEIRKVWASVWNWQAFEERSYRRVDHRKVFMGVAIHPSYVEEAANGVLITRNLADPAVDGFYVNAQPGEASVTNPVDGSLPETFTVAGGSVIRQRYSSLSPEKAVLTDGEIAQLEELASEVQRRFAELYGRDPRDPSFALELEFKVDVPGGSVFIKQARPFTP